MALPTRLSSTWRSRPASPTRASGTSGCTWQISSSPLLWARTASARSVSPDRRPQREVGRVQLQLAGRDLREVEQVVDDAEQVVGRRLDRLQALPLVVGQRRVEDQLGHAEDGVHGRANLVADVGQELVLGPVRRLRRLLGLARLLLQPFAFGDVLEDRDGVSGIARRVALERDGHVDPDRRAILADVAFLQRVAGAVRRA